MILYHYVFGACEAEVCNGIAKIKIPTVYKKYFNSDIMHIRVDELSLSSKPFPKIVNPRFNFKEGELVWVKHRWFEHWEAAVYIKKHDYYEKHVVKTQSDSNLYVDQCVQFSAHPLTTKVGIKNCRVGDKVGSLRERASGTILSVTENNIEVSFNRSVSPQYSSLELYTPDGRHHKSWPKTLYQI